MDKCLSPLRTIIRVCGKEIVQHYQSAIRGERYCKHMRTTAMKVTNLEEFLIKRRDRCRSEDCLKLSINLIDPVDLVNVRKWESMESYVKVNDPANDELSYERITIEDVPEDTR